MLWIALRLAAEGNAPIHPGREKPDAVAHSTAVIIVAAMISGPTFSEDAAMMLAVKSSFFSGSAP